MVVSGDNIDSDNGKDVPYKIKNQIRVIDGNHLLKCRRAGSIKDIICDDFGTINRRARIKTRGKSGGEVTVVLARGKVALVRAPAKIIKIQNRRDSCGVQNVQPPDEILVMGKSKIIRGPVMIKCKTTEQVEIVRKTGAYRSVSASQIRRINQPVAVVGFGRQSAGEVIYTSGRDKLIQGPSMRETLKEWIKEKERSEEETRNGNPDDSNKPGNNV